MRVNDIARMSAGCIVGETQAVYVPMTPASPAILPMVRLVSILENTLNIRDTVQLQKVKRLARR